MVVVAVYVVVDVITQPLFSKDLHSNPADTLQVWPVLCWVPLESIGPLWDSSVASCCR